GRWASLVGRPGSKPRQRRSRATVAKAAISVAANMSVIVEMTQSRPDTVAYRSNVSTSWSLRPGGEIGVDSGQWARPALRPANGEFSLEALKFTRRRLVNGGLRLRSKRRVHRLLRRWGKIFIVLPNVYP